MKYSMYSKYDHYADKENDYIFKFNEVSSHSFQT